MVNKDSNGHRAQHVNSTARVEAHAACDSLLDRLHASDVLHVTPRQIFRALPAHIRHVGCVDASCDGGSKCSSYEDFLGYVGQSLCARAQSTLRERARACLHDRRQNNTLPARSTCSQFTVELHGLVCDDVGRGIGLRRDGDLDCLRCTFTQSFGKRWMTLSVNTTNHVDATRLNAFQMGTGTTGARAINLAKRALAEDQCLQRERVEHGASVRGGNKVRATLVGGEGSGCQ